MPLYLENGNVFIETAMQAKTEVGNLKDADIKNGMLIINNMALPLVENAELKTAWDELYPNGKPIEVVEPEPKVITEEEKAQDLLKVIALNIMNNNELLKTFGIEPRHTETTTT